MEYQTIGLTTLGHVIKSFVIHELFYSSHQEQEQFFENKVIRVN
ncbi:hypothetical protein [Candidatus Enterovibrio altilux]|nr:hypothetical protein [Candidatus Enterovibrio luxaltus]